MRQAAKIAALAALGAALALATGCSVSVSTGPVDVVSSPQTLTSTPGNNVESTVQGYVYVPSTRARADYTPANLVYGSASSAPAGWAPAVGVVVSGATETAARATTAETGPTGFFEITLTFSGAPNLVLDFAAATPAWTAEDIGTTSGEAGGCDVFAPGFLKRSKDLTTVSNADRVERVNSFNGVFNMTNESGQELTVDVWIADRDDLTIDDLFTNPTTPVEAVDDGATELYHMVQKTVPTGVNDIEAPWTDILNKSPICAMLNPNDPPAYITIYATTRPTAASVTLNSFTINLNVNASVLEADGAKSATQETVTIKFL